MAAGEASKKNSPLEGGLQGLSGLLLGEVFGVEEPHHGVEVAVGGDIAENIVGVSGDHRLGEFLALEQRNEVVGGLADNGEHFLLPLFRFLCLYYIIR